MRVSLRSRWWLAAACGLALAVCLSERVDGQDRDSRQWISRDGLQRVRATLVQFDPATGRVTLRDAQGQERDLALQQLSLRDQKFLRRNAESKTSNSDLDSDPKPETAAAESAAPKSAQPAPGKTRRLYGVDWQPSVETGLEVARNMEEDGSGRPVMWFRVLGDLDGLM